jgi:hypothetical protein
VPGETEVVQITMQQPQFDLDNEITGLRGQMGKLKTMSQQIGEESRIHGELISGLVCRLPSPLSSKLSDRIHLCDPTSRVWRVRTTDYLGIVSLSQTQEESMEKARSALKRSMKRMNKAYEQSKSNHLLYLVLFSLATLLGLYFFAKIVGTVRWIFGY